MTAAHQMATPLAIRSSSSSRSWRQGNAASTGATASSHSTQVRHTMHLARHSALVSRFASASHAPLLAASTCRQHARGGKRPSGWHAGPPTARHTVVAASALLLLLHELLLLLLLLQQPVLPQEGVEGVGKLVRAAGGRGAAVGRGNGISQETAVAGGAEPCSLDVGMCTNVARCDVGTSKYAQDWPCIARSSNPGPHSQTCA